MNKKRIKLLLEYDGTRYCGWQYQPDAVSIQETVEVALQKLTGESIRIYTAGRTDAGVHAKGQVVHFDTGSKLNMDNFYKGLNYYLPNDIAVLEAVETDPEFHARYSAKSRSYQYLIKRNYSSLMQNRAWIYIGNLDVDSMKKAIPWFLGEHDFKSFCSTETQLDHYRCNVMNISLEEEGDLITFNIRANRFVHNMVRAIVGTLHQIGKGMRSPQDIPDILKARDRTKAGPSAPPQGLYLMKIEY
ncbi:MAG: tRNA pseudouridine(38-40) synthase TruA [Calditrichia bacterium]